MQLNVIELVFFMIGVFGLCSVLNKFWGGQRFIRLINIGSEEGVGFVFLGSQLVDY